MSVNEAIIATATPVVSVCVPDLYQGEAEEYCTFNTTEIPEAFGDNAPKAVRHAVQLHYYCPKGWNSLQKRRQLRRAIAAEEGFTAPTVTNASDGDGQHYVFEFEALEAW